MRNLLRLSALAVFCLGSANATTLWVTSFSSTVHLFDSVTGAAAGTLTAPGPASRIATGNDLVYLLDNQNNAVYEYNSSGAYVGTLASSISSTGFDVANLVVGPDGNIYISLGISNSIVEYDSTGSYIGVYGAGPSGTGHALGGLVFSGTTLYAADFQGKQILQYAAGGGSPTVFATLSASPDSLAFGPNGHLYASTTSGIFDVTSSSTLVSSGYSGVPRGLEFESDGKVYFAAQGGSGIYRANATGGTASLFATNSGSLDFAFVTTPEPGTLLLGFSALLALTRVSRRKH